MKKILLSISRCLSGLLGVVLIFAFLSLYIMYGLVELT